MDRPDTRVFTIWMAGTEQIRHHSLQDTRVMHW